MLKELEKSYEELLKADLKVIPEKVNTLFDIAGFPHYENVMSNFYSFYLDPNEQHGFTDLFISALSNIIKTKRNDDLTIISNFRLCLSKREVRTDKGKYIDIVVGETSEIDDELDNVFENAIIIENKVNANVYNDLMEYYNSIKVNKKKIGVVLSLREEENLPKQFISITHDEFINQVEQSSGSYFLNAGIKETIILKEFIQNIKYMTQTNNRKDLYEFFFKHQDKIKEISELYLTLKRDVFSQLDDVCEKLDLNLDLKGKHNFKLRYFSSKTAPIYFTIWIENLFIGKGDISIIIELNNEGIKRIEKINEIRFTKEEEKLLHEKSDLRKTYVHYAMIKLTPSPEEIKDFTNYIYNKITQTPLKDIFIKIEKQLTDNT